MAKLIVVLVLSSACGRGDSSADNPSGQPALSQVEALVGRPLAEVEDSLGTGFSIRVPQGLETDHLRDGSAKRWQAYDSGNPFIVMVRYSASPPRTLDEYLAAEGVSHDAVFVDKQTLPDGSFRVLTRRPDDAGVNAFATTSDHRVSCQAAYASRDLRVQLPDLEATLRYLEEICRSLTLK